MKLITMTLLYFLLAVTGFARTVPSIRSTQSTVPGNLHIREIADSIWAGSIVTAASELSFYSVTGTLIAPDPKLPVGGNSSETWYGSAWVGIDWVGDGEGGLFQAGIEWVLSPTVNNGDSPTKLTFEAWYEWLPEPFYSMGNIAISPGDVITIQCQAATASNGTCWIGNQSTGAVVSKNFQSPSIGNDLKGHNAEWIVEKLSYNGEYHFANFGTVEWFDCAAGTRTVPGNAAPPFLYPGDGEQVETLGSGGVTVSTFGENMVVIYND